MRNKILKNISHAIFTVCLFLLNPLISIAHIDELKIGINQDFDTLNPALAGTSAAKYMLFFA